MKIGLLTFHFGYNYGGILQCLALQQVLIKMGYEVEVINYCPYQSKTISFMRGWGLRSGKVVENIKIRYFVGRMIQKCDIFKNKHLRLSERCNKVEDLAKLSAQYDAIIVGSDQVWNRVYHDGPEYFLGWLPPYLGKRISYAASCGFADQPPGDREQMRMWLDQFYGLSARDQVTFDLVHDLCGRTTEIVADPTLLCDFKNISLSPKPVSGKYILMYTLGEEIEGGHKKIIENIQQRQGMLPVLQVVPVAHKCTIYLDADKKIFDASPDDWMRLIAGAAFVYTDSFHAALFSIKYKKPFLAYFSEKMRSARLLDLASRYKVQNAIVSSLKDAEDRQCFDAILDFENIQSYVKRHVMDSISYLNKVLSK